MVGRELRSQTPIQTRFDVIYHLIIIALCIYATEYCNSEDCELRRMELARFSLMCKGSILL